MAASRCAAVRAISSASAAGSDGNCPQFDMPALCVIDGLFAIAFARISSGERRLDEDSGSCLRSLLLETGSTRGGEYRSAYDLLQGRKGRDLSLARLLERRP